MSVRTSYSVRRSGTLVVGLFLALGLGSGVATAQPTDLAMVPADAAGFVSIDAAAIYKSDLFADVRETINKAGPKALADLDEQYIPKPSTFQRATAFVIMEPGKEPLPIIILSFSAPIPVEDAVKTYMPEAKKSKVGDQTVYTQHMAAVYFPDDRHIVIGLAPAVEKYLAKPVAKEGELAAAIRLAATRPLVVAGNVSALPIDQIVRDLPPDVLPLLKAKLAVASLDLTTGVRLEVTASYADEAAAEGAEKVVTSYAEKGRKELAKLKEDLEAKVFVKKPTPRAPQEFPEAVAAVMGLGSIKRLDELLAKPTFLVRTGADLKLSLTIPKEIASAFTSGLSSLFLWLRPAKPPSGSATPTPVMDAGTRQSHNNLRRMALALHQYEAANGEFPRAAAIVDKTGKPLLSWRVAMLPYLDQKPLYEKFKLDEPWDSPNNKPLSQIVVKVFVSPQLAEKDRPAGMTYYKAVRGPEAFFDLKKAVRIQDVQDGTSNTVLLVEGGEPVVWTKPDEFDVDAKKPLPKLFLPGIEGQVNVAFADGSVRSLRGKQLAEKTLRALFSPAGGEVVDIDP